MPDDAAWSPAGPSKTTAGLGAVVLAGGRSARFRGGSARGAGGGAGEDPGDETDKTRALVDGVPLLAHALSAVPPSVPCVVVGPRRPDDAGLPRAAELVWALEERRFGGPALALAAGLDHLPDDVDDVLVLAADQPFAASAVRVLLALRARQTALDRPDCWVAVDANGLRQPLLGLYAVAPLRRAVEAALKGGAPGAGASGRGPSLRGVLAGLRVLEVSVPEGSTLDVDTPEDLRDAGTRRPPG